METTTLLIFFSFCMLLFYYYYYSRVIKSKDKGVSLPPGRWGWPVVGESLEFLSNGWRGEPEKFMLKRMKKYSTTLFRTYLFGEPTVVMCGPAANKFLFTNENKLVQSWWPSSVDKLFPSSNLRSSSSKEEAIRMRKMLPSFFKPEALKQYVGIMDELTRRHFGSEWENKEVVHVYPLTKSLTFWMACRIFISVDDPRQVAEIGEPFDVLAAGVFSIPIDIPGMPFRRAIKASEWIRKELMRIIKQRKTDLEAGRSMQQHDILTHMLQTAREETGKNYELEDIADKILGLLIGGHDTASSACAFIVYYLANLPHIYQLVQQEQMEIAETKREGELLNWDDIQKMKYSWNVACEVLRLAPPVPGAFREALVDFNYNGFSIPKGWKLYWSAISTHINTEYFEEPLKFDPTRFEEKGPAPYTFVPFGGGPRMCPGKEYARLEILVFMHHLVKRFRWEKLIPQEKVIFNPFPIPANGLPIRLFAHHSSDDD